jgi:hypothetical protein
MLYNKDLPQELSDYFKTVPSYVEDYAPTMLGYRMFVFELPKDTLAGYVKHILVGEYSKADKVIVDKHFPLSNMHPRYGNRLVFERSDLWRKDWEEKIGVSLPENAEVWPRPFPKRETYGYIANNDVTKI